MSTDCKSLSRGEKLMVALGVLLAANLCVSLVSVVDRAGTSVANAQVQGFSRNTPAAEAAGGAAGGPAAPTTSVQVLSRLGDLMAEANNRLDRIERRLDGELKVRVTAMPAAAQPKQ
jgi:hypothetical protein